MVHCTQLTWWPIEWRKFTLKQSVKLNFLKEVAKPILHMTLQSASIRVHHHFKITTSSYHMTVTGFKNWFCFATQLQQWRPKIKKRYKLLTIIKQNTKVLFTDNAKQSWDEPQNTIEVNPNNNVILHLTVSLEEVDYYPGTHIHGFWANNQQSRKAVCDFFFFTWTLSTHDK